MEIIVGKKKVQQKVRFEKHSLLEAFKKNTHRITSNEVFKFDEEDGCVITATNSKNGVYKDFDRRKGVDLINGDNLYDTYIAKYGKKDEKAFNENLKYIFYDKNSTEQSKTHAKQFLNIYRQELGHLSSYFPMFIQYARSAFIEGYDSLLPCLMVSLPKEFAGPPHTAYILDTGEEFTLTYKTDFKLLGITSSAVLRPIEQKKSSTNFGLTNLYMEGENSKQYLQAFKDMLDGKNNKIINHMLAVYVVKYAADLKNNHDYSFLIDPDIKKFLAKNLYHKGVKSLIKNDLQRKLIKFVAKFVRSADNESLISAAGALLLAVDKRNFEKLNDDTKKVVDKLLELGGKVELYTNDIFEDNEEVELDLLDNNQKANILKAIETCIKNNKKLKTMRENPLLNRLVERIDSSRADNVDEIDALVRILKIVVEHKHVADNNKTPLDKVRKYLEEKIIRPFLNSSEACEIQANKILFVYEQSLTGSVCDTLNIATSIGATMLGKDILCGIAERLLPALENTNNVNLNGYLLCANTYFLATSKDAIDETGIATELKEEDKLNFRDVIKKLNTFADSLGEIRNDGKRNRIKGELSGVYKHLLRKVPNFAKAAEKMTEIEEIASKHSDRGVFRSLPLIGYIIQKLIGLLMRTNTQKTKIRGAEEKKAKTYNTTLTLDAFTSQTIKGITNLKNGSASAA